MESETTTPKLKADLELPPPHERVRDRLKALKITQVELAEMLDTSQANVSKALRGKNKELLFEIIEQVLVAKHRDEKRNYIDTAADRIAAKMDSIDEITGVLKQVVKGLQEVTKDIKEMKKEQLKMKKDIEAVRKDR